MTTALARARRLGLAPPHAATLARLRTPERIQDFVAGLRVNFEPDGDTCRSVASTLTARRAHCIEAAFVAACALWISGERPLLLDFQADGDDDHVAALFRRDGCWGAISKSNHVWLRYRDPIYRSVRELGMSYLHEYTRRDRKTLRRISRPYDLERHDPAAWITNVDPCWDVAEALDRSPHVALITRVQATRLRRRDALEREADELRQARPPGRSAGRRGVSPRRRSS